MDERAHRDGLRDRARQVIRPHRRDYPPLCCQRLHELDLMIVHDFAVRFSPRHDYGRFLSTNDFKRRGSAMTDDEVSLSHHFVKILPGQKGSVVAMRRRKASCMPDLHKHPSLAESAGAGHLINCF